MCSDYYTFRNYDCYELQISILKGSIRKYRFWGNLFTNIVHCLHITISSIYFYQRLNISTYDFEFQPFHFKLEMIFEDWMQIGPVHEHNRWYSMKKMIRILIENIDTRSIVTHSHKNLFNICTEKVIFWVVVKKVHKTKCNESLLE